MRVVFFGSPPEALPSLLALLKAGHSVELVITQPDKPAGRGRKLSPSAVRAFALEHGLPTLTPVRIRKDESVLPRIEEARPDVQVVVAYGQIIPDSIIYFPRFHTVNVHFSLLPRYRGASPVSWAILNGETKSGVTIIELNAKMDEGDILARAETAVGPRETAPALEARLAEMGASLLVETLARIEDIRPLPQEAALASYAPKQKKEDGRIDWSSGAAAIDRKVRAFLPWPTAFAYFRGSRIVILEGEAGAAGATGEPPGTILSVDRKGIEVACGPGSSFLIKILQPEGRKRMDAYAFSLGVKIKPGDLLF